MKLIVVHSHFRPGGVRRVIESALPPIVRGFRPKVREVVLVSGESIDPAWRRAWALRIAGVSVRVVVEAALGYVAEQRSAPAVRRRRIRRCVGRLLEETTAEGCVVWQHNPSLARNPEVTRVLAKACASAGVPLVLHHHDWWFDNRWARWDEMRASGLRHLPAIARTVLPAGGHVRHATINQADAAVLSRWFPGQVGWLPNPVSRGVLPSPGTVREARRWLAECSGRDGPVWLLPARLLRRKNVAEALLLTRWLRPEAWLATTGGPSSEDERPYAEALEAAARRHDWPLRLGMLARGTSGAPAVADLMAASEAILLTSLSEGFGLPYVEAVGAERPLIARSLANVAPDLERFGFRLPQLYSEVRVDVGAFDHDAEVSRQAERFERWRRGLPSSCRRWVGEPWLLGSGRGGGPVGFGRLTLIAQLEVLSLAPDVSWKLCARWNPALEGWRRAAGRGRLAVAPWPAEAERWLGGAAYARRFSRLVHRTTKRPEPASAGVGAQARLLEERLDSDNLYPLLWSSRP